MDDTAKPIYSLFPPPKSPVSSSTPSQHRPRHSIDRKRGTSLDPLPPIEEPPHPPPPAPSDANLPESPVLKPIHSLYNPQPARPSSRRGASERHERRRSLNRQLPPPENLPPLERDLPLDPKPTQQPAPTPSRASSLKHHPRPSQSSQKPLLADSPPRPSTAQGMHTNASLTLRPENPALSTSTSSSLSLSKPPILSPTSTVAPGKPFTSSTAARGGAQAQYNKTPYFHGGIGGRGNYRKVKREDKGAPLAYAPNAGPISSRGRFLTKVFGAGRRKGNSSEREDGDRVSEDNSSGSRGSSEREEVALGAAEVMRRKLLRQAGVRTGRRAESWERR